MLYCNVSVSTGGALVLLDTWNAHAYSGYTIDSAFFNVNVLAERL